MARLARRSFRRSLARRFFFTARSRRFKAAFLSLADRQRRVG
jgi:hypothetical protein